MLVGLFQAERGVEECARALGRAYATTFHALTVLRADILVHSADSKALSIDDVDALLDVCRHRGRKVLHVAGHVPVFGIQEERDTVTVLVLPDLGPDAVLAMPVKKVRRGSVVYTGQVARYDTLMFSVPDELVDRSRAQFARSPAPIDGASRFWAYASPRLAAHRGVAPEYFPLYLKELEFRYNHRGASLKPLLLRYLCDLVPDAHH
jgi:transposase